MVITVKYVVKIRRVTAFSGGMFTREIAAFRCLASSIPAMEREGSSFRTEP